MRVISAEDLEKVIADMEPEGVEPDEFLFYQYRMNPDYCFAPIPFFIWGQGTDGKRYVARIFLDFANSEWDEEGSWVWRTANEKGVFYSPRFPIADAKKIYFEVLPELEKALVWFI